MLWWRWWGAFCVAGLRRPAVAPHTDTHMTYSESNNYPRRIICSWITCSNLIQFITRWAKFFLQRERPKEKSLTIFTGMEHFFSFSSICRRFFRFFFWHRNERPWRQIGRSHRLNFIFHSLRKMSSQSCSWLEPHISAIAQFVLILKHFDGTWAGMCAAVMCLLGACCIYIVFMWMVYHNIHTRTLSNDWHALLVALLPLGGCYHALYESYDRAAEWNKKKWENAADVGLEVLWLRIIRGLASEGEQHQQKKYNIIYTSTEIDHRLSCQLEFAFRVRI